ncbi:MAG TPA: TetR/AcrR family transcriptional regulator [Solirubrobacteraceae bacterium]|jgi:AcrR family transcriptional regulator|nr:TetR/AcrR family transcriptional regulator [Solirubrobacteraceae bacterium]
MSGWRAEGEPGPASSPSRPSRKERQAETRRRLLRSATRVFARCGLHQASIDDVAHDAGYTKGAFYANFASKQDLFLAMLDERFADRAEQIERSARRREDVPERARAAGDEFVAALAADPEWQRLFFEFAAHAARDESFRGELIKRYRSLRNRLAEVFNDRAPELGGEPPVSPQELAVMTFAMANGFALERLLEPEAVDEAAFGRMLMIFFTGLRTLSADGSARWDERPVGGADPPPTGVPAP